MSKAEIEAKKRYSISRGDDTEETSGIDMQRALDFIDGYHQAEKDNVNHPRHYNSHPNGIECIDVIRHYVCDIANAIKYLWRAGLKTEMGMDDIKKEIEDLKKALWYIEDYRVKIPQLLMSHFKSRAWMQQIVIEVTGHAIDEIAYCGYDDHIATAIGNLLCVGIIRRGNVCVILYWESEIREATDAIQQRILELNNQSAL